MDSNINTPPPTLPPNPSTTPSDNRSSTRFATRTATLAAILQSASPSQTSEARQSTMPKAPRKSVSGESALQVSTTAKSFSSRKARGSKDSMTSRDPPQSPSPTPAKNRGEELLQTLKTEFETIRSIIACKICYGFLYEPYTTSCGHTYCYSCLRKAFRLSQSCPECRTVIRNAPAPAYIVRELTHAFIKRVELLPVGETKEQHGKWQEEHSAAVQRDKSNTDRRTGGLWGGYFRSRPPPRRVLHDVEDGVDRCPYCQWELEDGSCQRCTLPFDEDGTGTWDFSEDGDHVSIMNTSEEDIEMDDDEDGSDHDNDVLEAYRLEVSDQFGYGEDYDLDNRRGAGRPSPPYAIQRFFQNSGMPQHVIRNQQHLVARARAAHSAAGSRRRSHTASVSEMADSEMIIMEEDEDEDDNEDEDSSMAEFIAEDDEVIPGGSVISSSASDSTSYGHSRQRSESVAEVDEEEEARAEDTEDTEDEAPIPSGRRRFARSQPHVAPTPQPRRTQASSRQRRVERSSSSLTSLSWSQHDGVGADDSAARNSLTEAEDTVSTSDGDEGPIAPTRRRTRGSQTHSQQETTSHHRSGPRLSQFESQTSTVGERGHSADLPVTVSQGTVRSLARGARAADAINARRGTPYTNMGYAPLGGREEGDEDEDEESDGGRTTVGWEPITINDNARNAGSLTPTADRPNPLNRPQSRTGSLTFPLGSRGIRRRSSQISISSALHYEDNDADDDVSDADEETDANRNSSALQQQPSNLRLRYSAMQQQLSEMAIPQTQPTPNNYDVDSDDTDVSTISPRHGHQVRRQEAYNPHISLLLAQHMTDLQNTDYHYPIIHSDIAQLRASNRTPLARPRTANRNRVASIGGVPALLMSTVGPRPALRTVQSPHVNLRPRHSTSDAGVIPAVSSVARNTERPPSGPERIVNHETNVATGAHSDEALATSIVASTPLPTTLRSNVQSSPASHMASPAVPLPHVGNSIDRPNSRASVRPPSASGRRGSTAWSHVSTPQGASTGTGPGLHTARMWQNRNPFYNLGAVVRPRQSIQRLRDQSSSTTLRSRGSRILRHQPSQIVAREVESQSPQMRPQASRIQLRTPPSDIRAQRQPIMRSSLAAESVNMTVDPQTVVSHQSVSPRRYGQHVNPIPPDLFNEHNDRREQRLANHNPFYHRNEPRMGNGANSSSMNLMHSSIGVDTSTRARTANESSAAPYHHADVSVTQSAGVGRRRSNGALANPVPPGTGLPAQPLQIANTGYTRTRAAQLPGRSSNESHFSSGVALTTANNGTRRN